MTHPSDKTGRAAPDLEDLTPAEREWEGTLSTLHPAGPAGDGAAAFRDRVMYRAGQAAGKAAAGRANDVRQLWAWRGATAASLALSAGLAAQLLVHSRRPAGPDRLVALPTSGPGAPAVERPWPPEPRHPQPTRESSPPRDHPAPGGWRAARIKPGSFIAFAGVAAQGADYLSTREAVLRWGVRALPDAAGASQGAGADGVPSPRDLPAPPGRPPLPVGSAGSIAGPFDGIRRFKQWLLPTLDGGQL